MRTAGESRGFAVSRLLTRWPEIVGQTVADICDPLKVTYAKGGFGATLILLTRGAQAQMLEMQLPQIREKVNACYGYNAIARIRITQTAPTGFREGQAVFQNKSPAAPREKLEKHKREAAAVAAGVSDPKLREALEAFGENILHGKKVKL